MTSGVGNRQQTNNTLNYDFIFVYDTQNNISAPKLEYINKITGGSDKGAAVLLVSYDPGFNTSGIPTIREYVTTATLILSRFDKTGRDIQPILNNQLITRFANGGTDLKVPGREVAFTCREIPDLFFYGIHSAQNMVTRQPQTTPFNDDGYWLKSQDYVAFNFGNENVTENTYSQINIENLVGLKGKFLYNVTLNFSVQSESGSVGPAPLSSGLMNTGFASQVKYSVSAPTSTNGDITFLNEGTPLASPSGATVMRVNKNTAQGAVNTSLFLYDIGTRLVVRQKLATVGDNGLAYLTLTSLGVDGGSYLEYTVSDVVELIGSTWAASDELVLDKFTATQLNELRDVSVATPPTDNDLLKYNSITQVWENDTIGLNELTDVDLSFPTENDSLKLNSASLWVNRYEARVVGATPDFFQFKTQFSGNNPASGAILFIDGADANVGVNWGTAVKVRISNRDVNGYEHLFAVAPATQHYTLLLNRVPQNNSTAFGIFSFTVTDDPNPVLQYIEYSISPSIIINPPADNEFVSLSFDTKLPDNVTIHVKNPTWAEFYPVSLPYILSVPTFDTYYFVTTSAGNRSADFDDDGAGNITYTGISAIIASFTLSVAAFADVQDTRLSFKIARNGVPLPDDFRCINFSKNSVNFAESTSSISHTANVAVGDVFSVVGAFIEDNSPAANPTQIAIENIRVIIHQVSY